MRPRLIITVILAVVFFTVGPALVLWTAGYRWNQRALRLEATGVLIIDSEPKGALISIGETRLAERTPARIAGLLPREYTLTVSSPGYKSWRQTIEIEGGKTTFVEQIRIFPERLPELVASGEITSLVSSPDQKTLAFNAVKDGESGIFTVDAQRETPVLIEKTASSSLRSLEWAPSGIALLLTQKTAQGFKSEIISAGAKTELPLTGELANIACSQDDPTRLLAQTQSGPLLTTWLLHSSGAAPWQFATSTEKTAALGRTAIVANNLIYSLEREATSTAIYSSIVGSRDKTLLTKLPGSPYYFLNAKYDYLVLQNPLTSKIITVNAGSRRIETKISGTSVLWSPAGRPALAVWDNHELNIFTADKNATAVTRLGENIRAVNWLPQGNELLLLTDTALLAIERESSGNNRVTTELVALADGKTLAVANGYVYFVATLGSKTGLYRLALK